MPKPVQWVLSLIFNIQMYLAFALIGIAMAIPVLINRNLAVVPGRVFSQWVLFSARWIVGLKVEVRGEVPQGEVLVAAKHQSFFDILAIYAQLPSPKFIMKAELRFVPIWGFYAQWMGCVPVNRGKRGAAITKMMADVKSGASRPGQLVIYPQGTRVPPGQKLPYKAGTAILYSQLRQPCVPVATNVGVFWPKRGVMRHRGTAVVEFLPAIEPGLSNAEFLARLETEVETHSDRLMAEAGLMR